MEGKELNAYVDEAGDEGFAPGASQWFILSAIVVRSSADREVAIAVNEIKKRLWGQATSQPLHRRRLKHTKKRVVIQELKRHGFVFFSVAMEKKYLARERFDSKYKKDSRRQFRWAMYFYAARLLAERVCKHAERHGMRVNFVFENRSSISYQNLRDYLTFMTLYPGPYSSKPTIKSEIIKSLSSHNKQVKKLLQVADACSGALRDALEIDQYGNVEPSYLLELAEKFERVNGRLWGYGLKIFPRSEGQLRSEYPCYEWMTKI